MLPCAEMLIVLYFQFLMAPKQGTILEGDCAVELISRKNTLQKFRMLGIHAAQKAFF